MQALVGLAAQGEGAARRLDDAVHRMAADADVRRLSRPWWTPAAPGERAGLVAAALVQPLAHKQETRGWARRLERDDGLQAELIAGLDPDHHAWRWGVDVAGEDAAWAGPLADIVPGLALPNGLHVIDQATIRPHPGAFPWMDAGHGPVAQPTDVHVWPGIQAIQAGQGPVAVPVGRTWESYGYPPGPRRRSDWGHL